MFDHGIFRAIWSSLLPEKCLICDDFFSGQGACQICFSLLKGRLPPLCERCGVFMTSKFGDEWCTNCQLNPPVLRRFESPYDYEPIAGILIRFAKQYGQPRLVQKLLDYPMHLSANMRATDYDCVVPIPPRKSRYIKTGFSASMMVAQRLAEELETPLEVSALSWSRKTIAQTGLSKAERQSNVKGAFCSERIEGRRILLVDDVYTTGSTLNAAAKALKKIGASFIDGFTLCAKDPSFVRLSPFQDDLSLNRASLDPSDAGLHQFG